MLGIATYPTFFSMYRENFSFSPSDSMLLRRNNKVKKAISDAIPWVIKVAHATPATPK